MNLSRKECLESLRNKPHIIEPGQKFVVDDFKPEDGPGVAQLYYAVYGEMFPVDHVYNPAELVRLNAGTDLHQVVGRTEKGDIVGLYALFRNPPGRRIMEAGSWMVHPAYRKTSLSMRLAARINATPPKYLKLDAIFGQNVCDHTTSQRMGIKYDTIYCALEVEAMPPRPVSHNEAYSGRISLLNGFIIYQDCLHDVFLPQPYSEYLRSTYSSYGLNRNFLDDPGPDKDTRAIVQPMNEADIVRLTIEQTGRDLVKHLAQMENDYPGRHAYQLVLPLWQPGSTMAVNAAQESGYFFGGLLPLWFDQDGLLMQKLSEKPDFSLIKLFPEEAHTLLDFIKNDYKSLQ